MKTKESKIYKDILANGHLTKELLELQNIKGLKGHDDVRLNMLQIILSKYASFQLHDVAAILGVTVATASHCMRKFRDKELVVMLSRTDIGHGYLMAFKIQ